MAKTIDELTYCGTDCEGCDIYRSTVFGEKLRPETIQKWQDDFKKYWKLDSITPDQLNCKGCRYEGEDVFFGFKLCPIRNCCKKRGLSSCGLCSEFNKCKQHDIPEGRENLKRMLKSQTET